MNYEAYTNILDEIKENEISTINKAIESLRNGAISAHTFTYMMGELHKATSTRAGDAFNKLMNEA